MADFPHIEDLLKRPDIQKPAEEFIVPPPEPAVLPFPEVSTLPPVSTVAASAAVQSLLDESNQIQNLIDLVTSSIDEVEVAVPETEASLIGDSITTRQYIDALQADPSDPNASRVTKSYEQAILDSPGEHWPILALRDMFDIRDTLRTTAGIMTGTALAATNITSGGVDWALAAVNSHLSNLQETLLQNSVQFRAKFLHATLTLNLDLQGQFLETLLNPLLSSVEQDIKENLRQLRSLLVTLRDVFGFSLYFRAVEFSQIRDAVENAVTAHLVRSALQTLVVLLSRATQNLIHPIIDFLENGFKGSGPLTRATDKVTQQVAGVVVDAVGALTSYYSSIASDLIRGQQKKSNISLDKLQVLGEHSTTSRWIRHIEEAIKIIDVALARASLTKEVAAQVANSIRKGVAPSTSKVLEQVKQIPGIEVIEREPFSFRGEPSEEERRNTT